MAGITTPSEVTSQERQRLINSCQGLVRSIAWKIHQRLPSHVDLEDLVSYGQIGLAEAARDFDPGRGRQFTTFAWYRVRGAILDGLAKMQWFRRFDFESGRYERMAHETLADVTADETPARSPEEVLERQGAWLKGVSSTLAVACLGSWSECGGEGEIVDSGIERPDSIIIRREMAARLRELVAALPENIQGLIRGTFFEGKTLTQAAAEAGISKAWASRLHARGLAQLAETLQSADCWE
jgi:RNA polymerase sigma factor for flagellar operon FliA